MQDQKREIGYGNISLFKAIDEIKSNQLRGLTSLIISKSVWDKMIEFESKLNCVTSRITHSQLLEIIQNEVRS